MDENQISYEEIDREIEERAAAKRKRLPHEIFDLAELVLIVLALLLLLTTFLFRQTVVSGSSMEGTLKDGERLVISDFFYTPKAGDIVVLQVDEETVARYPHQLEKNQPIIKRIIATEGQTVHVLNSVVYVDNVPLDEDYVYFSPLRDDERADVAPFTVSEGHVYVMGDHRNNSLDSRWFGEVDERTIVGKVLFRLYPFAKFGGVD